MELWEMSETKQAEEIRKKIVSVIETETQLRRWQRRLIVAITPEEVQKCKAKINEYGG